MARLTTAAASGPPPQLTRRNEDRSTSPRTGLAHINATMVEAALQGRADFVCNVKACRITRETSVYNAYDYVD